MKAPSPNQKPMATSDSSTTHSAISPAIRAGFLITLLLSLFGPPATSATGVILRAVSTWALATLGIYPWLSAPSFRPNHRAVILGSLTGVLSGVILSFIYGSFVRSVVCYGFIGSTIGWVAAAQKWCNDFEGSSYLGAAVKTITDPIHQSLRHRTGFVRDILDESPRSWLRTSSPDVAQENLLSRDGLMLMQSLATGCLPVIAIVTLISLATPFHIMRPLAEMAWAMLVGSRSVGLLFRDNESSAASILWTVACSGGAAIVFSFFTLFCWSVWTRQSEQTRQSSRLTSMVLGGTAALSWYLFPLLYNWLFRLIAGIPMQGLWGFMIPAIQSADFAHSAAEPSIVRDWRLDEWPNYAIAVAVAFIIFQVAAISTLHAYFDAIKFISRRLVSEATRLFVKAEAQWHYSIDGKSVGPIPEKDLPALVAGGIVKADTPVWRTGTRNWIKAAEVRGLFGTSAMPPPLQVGEDEISSRVQEKSPRIGFHIQRALIIACCAVGAIGTFLPWATAPIVGTVYGTAGDGWVTFACFVLAFICVSIGERQYALDKLQWWGSMLFAGSAGAVAVSKLFGLYSRKTEMLKENDGNPFGEIMLQAFQVGPGLYVIVFASVTAICCAMLLRDSDYVI